jgi:hypothetical protein
MNRQFLECAGPLCSIRATLPARIPTGFCLKAQRCEERTTLGNWGNMGSTPKGLRLRPTGGMQPLWGWFLLAA